MYMYVYIYIYIYVYTHTNKFYRGPRHAVREEDDGEPGQGCWEASSIILCYNIEYITIWYNRT